MPSPRLAFDLAPAAADHPPGVRRATRALFEALRERRAFEWVGLEPARAGRGSLAWRQLELPARLAEARCRGLHSPVSAFPLRLRTPVVHTVHELPWRHGVAEGAGWRQRGWARHGSRRARASLCPSELVARDLGAEQPRARVQLVHWGCDPALLAPPLVPAARRSGLLQLGATRRKKALEASLRALAELAPAETSLTFTGPDGPAAERALALAAELGLGDRVRHVAHWSEAELRGALADAGALLCPSASEGFALPVLEALAAGTPAVVRRAGAAASWAGDAVVQVEPEDSRAYARGIERALACDDDRRRALRAHAARFTWEAAAARVDGLWSELLAGGAR